MQSKEVIVINALTSPGISTYFIFICSANLITDRISLTSRGDNPRIKFIWYKVKIIKKKNDEKKHFEIFNGRIWLLNIFLTDYFRGRCPVH